MSSLSSVISHPCRTITILCGAFLGFQVGAKAEEPHAPCTQRSGYGEFSELTVYEGLGLENIRFDMGPAEVEDALGPAEGGSENHLRYTSSGIYVCFCGASVKDIHFREGFRGRLFASGLAIDSTLQEVIAAYGDIKEEKLVANVCGWNLDRTLLVQHDGSTLDNPIAYKLSYYDAGLIFLFDENARVREFIVFKETSFLARIGEGSAPLGHLNANSRR